ncbi:uncharacterized protein DNG_01798 [Cephalotrichum gorgonifer]|uniref:Uncharacterized protein n=1 Tax=Cephalotrichum gorgonifer TaxID=2041049 RepID=A0AAE8SSN3_9PEZI|nr:uncharacterized protein DNG_01798 [Cephalotrichum gorgonifer]
MCHGQPSTHPCSHTSITWNYCSSAPLDLDTGCESPCADTSFAPSLATPSSCPLQNSPTARLKRDPKTFEVEAVQATWTSGCPTPDFPLPDPQHLPPRKCADGGSSRRPVFPSDEAQPSSSAPSSLSPSVSSPPRYAIDLDCSSLGKKNTSMEKKGQKGKRN